MLGWFIRQFDMPIEKPKLKYDKHTVYALAYPSKRKDKVFYVGVSMYPGKRFVDHLRGTSGNNDKDTLILQFRKQGKEPRLIILERNLTKTKAYKQESYWITKLEGEGHELVNRTRGGKFPGSAQYAASQKSRHKG